MQALVIDIKNNGWDNSRGFTKTEVPTPQIGSANPQDSENVVIKLKYAGVCGTDRGLWHRASFKDVVISSLEAGGKNQRVVGHEICGEIVDLGEEAAKKYNLKVGDFVSSESHIICSECYQCTHDQSNVCTNEKIMGISHDGGFAEFVKLPAKVLWPTDNNLIREELACLQEPFGNAVHSTSVVDLGNKNVLILGCGPVGLFTTIIASARGAKNIIVVDIKPENLTLAKSLGASHSLLLGSENKKNDWQADEEIVAQVLDITEGMGADIAFEMAGPNSSVNNALQSLRRGGAVVLFGLKGGHFTIPDFEKIVVKGITQHSIIGRRVFETWAETKKLFEDKATGVQEKLWSIILKGGQDTILKFADFTPEVFEDKMSKHPKFIIKF